MLFVGCEKYSKENKCWNCVTTITTTVSVPLEGYPQTTTMTKIVCDKDVEDKEAYEREGTLTITSTVSGISTTVRTVTNCRRQL